jgi:GMP synthase-like glutamine amidotransferase
MKPIAIIEHEAGVSAGRFAEYLDARGWPYRLIRVHAGDSIPSSASPYAGICSLGGSMSVNDPLPWIADELALIRDADSRCVPVIGHCLGGQLIARAFGAAVTRAPTKEIGWGRVEVDDRELATEWLGDAAVPEELFQWHEDAFELPADARRVLTGLLCDNQMFVLQRAGFAHLAMQFHVEMTTALVRTWLADPGAEREIAQECRAGSPGVQPPTEILSDLERRTDAMGKVAERLYARWALGLLK